MKKAMAVALATMMCASQSFAWMALASDANRNTFIYSGADSAEEAAREAVNMCQAKRTGCKADKA